MLELSGLENSAIKKVVALEMQENGKAALFIRESADSVRREDVTARPFIMLTDPQILNGCEVDCNITKLSGNAPYSYLADFENVETYENALKKLKEKTRFSPSSPNAPYSTVNDLCQQALISLDLRLFSGMTFGEMKRMQFDIETLSTAGYEFSNPKRESDMIIIISMSDSTGWEKVISADGMTEKELLEEFVRTVRERDPDLLEGHNIFRFDLPYIEERAKRHKVKLALGRDGSLPARRNSRISIAERTLNYTRYDIFGRHVADTYHLVLFYDAIHRNLDSYSLKYIAKHFNVASPERVYIDGSKITEAWHSDRKRLLAYALDDVREVRAVSAILSPSYFYQTQIVPLSYQNSIVRGNATRIDALLLAHYLKAKHAVPTQEPGRPFAGALTRAFDAGVFDNVWHCDVRSLYPSIILSEKWVPKRDALGVFPEILGKLRDFRLRAKDAARNASSKEEKDYYGALQSTFKILINSFYGYLGFEQGFLNDFDMAEKVTARGREILTLMLEILENSGANVIEMDTDGIYFQPAKGMKTDSLGKALEEKLPDGIEVDFDEIYKAMFCYKSKNYALLTESGEISIAGGALKSRGLESFQRDYIEETITCLLRRETSKIPELHRRYVEAVKNHKLPMEDLCKSETLSSSLDNYKKKLAEGDSRRSAAYELAIASGREYRQGDQVSFYITGTKKKVSVVGNSKLLADADEKNRDENIEYYLDKLEELRKKFEPFTNLGKSEDSAQMTFDLN